MRWGSIISIRVCDSAPKRSKNWPGHTLTNVSARFGVRLNSVENWARWWRQRGVVGLFRPARPGRPPKWGATRQRSGGESQLLDALGFFFLPPYSSELNRIEILWKQAKHYWRRPIELTGAALREAVDSLVLHFGTRFTIKLS